MVLSSEKNLYEILEVEFSASATTIKSAYRRLARKYHPDLNSGDAACEKKFKEVTRAYEILSDEEKKKNLMRMGFLTFSTIFWKGLKIQRLPKRKKLSKPSK